MKIKKFSKIGFEDIKMFEDFTKKQDVYDKEIKRFIG